MGQCTDLPESLKCWDCPVRLTVNRAGQERGDVRPQLPTPCVRMACERARLGLGGGHCTRVDGTVGQMTLLAYGTARTRGIRLCGRRSLHMCGCVEFGTFSAHTPESVCCAAMLGVKRHTLAACAFAAWCVLSGWLSVHALNATYKV